jgi:hypothetical protein
MRRTAPISPFRVAGDAVVGVEPWRISDGDELLGGRIEHWDPELRLGLDRTVTVDLGALLSETGIDSAADLALAAAWRSTRTRLRAAGTIVALHDRDGDAVTLAIEVPGRLTGGSLQLETMVVRTTAPTADAPLVARRPGSILWRDAVAVELEGQAARFPTSVVDFETIPGLDPDASWALEWSPNDLDQPVLGGLRVLVNARRDAIVAAAGWRSDPASLAIRSMIFFDVARSLVTGALANEEFVTGGREFEPDTVGRMLSDLLDRFWPGAAPAVLARRMAETPHRFESELQARTGLLAQ